MRIPLPSCYFAEDEDGTHMVIDGLQRLTTINLFFKDEFALEGMTTFKELEGKKFSELGEYQTELETTTIRCIVLRKDNPKSLIREIFSRLNQGAVQLSDQEIRHAIYSGSLDSLLIELGSIESVARFGMAENNEDPKSNLEPEEQVLRYFAFSDDPNLEGFGNSLKEFLDNYMEKNSALDSDSILKHRDRFLKALRICEIVFGDGVFTNPTVSKKRKGLVHYDLVMTTVGELDEKVAIDKAKEIRKAYHDLCNSDEFIKSLSGGLHNKSKMVRRRNKWNDLLKVALNG